MCVYTTAFTATHNMITYDTGRDWMEAEMASRKASEWRWHLCGSWKTRIIWRREKLFQAKELSKGTQVWKSRAYFGTHWVVSHRGSTACVRACTVGKRACDRLLDKNNAKYVKLGPKSWRAAKRVCFRERHALGGREPEVRATHQEACAIHRRELTGTQEKFTSFRTTPN